MRIPEFKEPGLTDFLTRQFGALERDIASKLKADSTNHSLLLSSPSGMVYEITVDDLGALVVTLVAG